MTDTNTSSKSREFITVGDYTASILFDDAGVKRHAIAGLINISAVIPNGAASKS
jgi:hypothetical protein